MVSLTFPETNQVVRHEMIDGEPWFHAGDVCKILNLQNPAQTLAPIEPGSKRKFDMIYGGSDPWFLDEEGLYTIAWRCRDAIKPGTVAYQFRKWVIGVIKTIRKTGQYTATAADQQYFQPFGITLQRKLEECERSIEATPVDAAEFTKRLAARTAIKRALKSEPKALKSSQELTEKAQKFAARFEGKGWINSTRVRAWFPGRSKPNMEKLREFMLALVGMGLAISNGETGSKLQIQIMPKADIAS